jgi:hypothetical protein
MAREITILKLGPDDAGMRLTAEEFASADFQEPYHVVLILTWKEDDYIERTLRPGDMYTTPMLPGLEVPLRNVFGHIPPACG